MTNYFSITTFTTVEPLEDPEFAIPFDFIRDQDIFVYNGMSRVPIGNVDGTYRVVEGRVLLAGSYPVGTRITIRRFTRRDSRLAEYFDGSTLTENDLNLMDRQLLFLIQELYDYLSISTSGGPTIPGGSGNPGPGGNDDDTSLIDTIIDEILNSQLFQDLIALIELNDINAELILQNALGLHEQWTRDRQFDGVVRDFGVELGAIDAKYETSVTILTNANQALVQVVDALGAQFNDARGDIVRIDTAIANETSARATAVALLQAQITGENGLVARIGTIEEAYVDEDEANAIVTTQLDSRFTQEGIEPFVNAAQIVTGLNTRANAMSATASGITSYIAGSGVTINQDGSINWGQPASGSLAWSAALSQQWINTNAGPINSSVQYLNSLSSAYGVSPGNPAALVAAVQQDYRTYADSQSASARTAQTLQANTRPILFSAQPPNPFTGAAYVGTFYQTDGFPEGTLWYRDNGDRSRTPFYWRPGATPPIGEMEVIEVRDGGSVRRAYWVRNRDSDQEALITAIMGARVDQVSFAQVFEDRVEAEIENKLVTVFDVGDISVVNAISERLVSLVNQDTGLVYSAWNVRINQSLGAGTPVIAGVGLGMQADLNNPQRGSVSNFIVMADRFSVIAPPSAGSFDPVSGQLDNSSVIVPFVIDTARGNVVVNGNLLARSMASVDAYVGRLIATQMDPNTFQPVDPTGARLVIPSSTNGFNIGGTSPFTGGTQRFLIWAGAGTMSHNNASFYVDTDGNAYFAGQVSADNIIGTFQNVGTVNWSGFANPATPAGLTQFSLPAPRRNGEFHTPVIMLAMNIQQVEAGNGVMEYGIDWLTPGGWVQIDGGTLNHGGGSGINHAISVIAPATNQPAVFNFRIGPGSTNPHHLRVQGVRGFVMGVR